MATEIEKLNNRINELENKIKSLESSTTIPFNIDRSFYERFKLVEFVKLKPSTKTVASETQTVDEGGSASYGVLKKPDGFEEREVGGVNRYYAYWL